MNGGSDLECREVKLRGAFVELNKLLKFENLVASGGEAKQAVLSGAVFVNGEVETRIRRKVREDDRVRLGDVELIVKGGTP